MLRIGRIGGWSAARPSQILMWWCIICSFQLMFNNSHEVGAQHSHPGFEDGYDDFVPIFRDESEAPLSPQSDFAGDLPLQAQEPYADDFQQSPPEYFSRPPFEDHEASGPIPVPIEVAPGYFDDSPLEQLEGPPIDLDQPLQSEQFSNDFFPEHSEDLDQFNGQESPQQQKFSDDFIPEQFPEEGPPPPAYPFENNDQNYRGDLAHLITTPDGRKDSDDEDSDDEDDHDDLDPWDHQEWPYGHGWYRPWPNEKYTTGKLGSRRQDWDYSTHSRFPAHAYGWDGHPLNKHGWSGFPVKKTTYFKYGHPLDKYSYGWPNKAQKLEHAYHYLKDKLNAKSKHQYHSYNKGHGHNHYAAGWGW